MSTKYLKGECSHCGGRVEFPAEAAGMTADCPHCGKSTELLLATPKEEPTVPRSLIVWTLVAVLVLTVGFGLALLALKRAQRWAERKKQAAAGQVASAPALSAQPNAALDPNDPVAKAEFRISEIKVEKAKGSSFTYAMGTITNITARPRYGVTVEFELFDAEGKKIGKASDYLQMIEPNGSHALRAPVMVSKTASAKVAAITEQ